MPDPLPPLQAIPKSSYCTSCGHALATGLLKSLSLVDTNMHDQVKNWVEKQCGSKSAFEFAASVSFHAKVMRIQLHLATRSIRATLWMDQSPQLLRHLRQQQDRLQPRPAAMGPEDSTVVQPRPWTGPSLLPLGFFLVLSYCFWPCSSRFTGFVLSDEKEKAEMPIVVPRNDCRASAGQRSFYSTLSSGRWTLLHPLLCLHPAEFRGAPAPSTSLLARIDACNSSDQTRNPLS